MIGGTRALIRLLNLVSVVEFPIRIKNEKIIFCPARAVRRLFSGGVQPEESDLKFPAEVAAFVERGTKAIWLETADLNCDGRSDFVLVLEKSETERDKDDFPRNQRPLLILVRQPDKSVKLARGNEKAFFVRRAAAFSATRSPVSKRAETLLRLIYTRQLAVD